MNIIKKVKNKWNRFFSINWIKSIYFNFKMLPLHQAKKMPILFFGKVKFTNISGTIVINSDKINFGMIGFGQDYENRKISFGFSQFHLEGNINFRGNFQFGKDYLLVVSKNAKLELGHNSSMGYLSKLMCYDSITFSDYCRIGFESIVMDTSSHQMINTITKEKFKITKPIFLGSYNYLGNNVSVLKGTKTSDYVTIAANSVCLKDYTSFGSNILIAGNPAIPIKHNVSRDWKGEQVWLDVVLKFRL